MIKVKHIDHVAIAVANAGEASLQLGGLFSLPSTPLERVADQNTDVIFLEPEGDTAIELICPSGNPSLARFLEKRGPGLHHICFEVEDLSASLAALKAAGVSLIDEAPRRGARGHWVAFLHPRATGGVLYELCQKGEHA
jgi:methylmalonyl-CoA/ethylmalonyl-CoA epimerase